MSGTTSSSGAVAGVGLQPPFTPAQWRELEHQALIYKYLMAGLPVPPDLVVPIRRSFDSISSRFFQHPSLAYSSYYGKKFDPEPGRCRRTDGKKWRCSKDAHPDSKYCERHMHRGRNRSRKPVESQSTSQSSSAVLSSIVTGSSGGSVSFQNLPLHSIVNPEGSFSASSVSKLQMEHVPYGINSREYRYFHGLNPEAEEHNFSPEASGSASGHRIDSNVESTWRLMPSQVPVNSPHLYMPQNIDPMMDAQMSKQRQQHCFLGSGLGSPGPAQQEHHRMWPFFDELPNSRDSWSDDLGDQRSNKNVFSTTRLSISTPMAPSDFSARSACSPKDA